mmetsp:Transcript_25245/g.79200  ORF Transcript_25245/g.79200 Transcript_25245/m.79200 type:complete len:201 (+) Transcript_25245:146-748(+)
MSVISVESMSASILPSFSLRHLRNTLMATGSRLRLSSPRKTCAATPLPRCSPSKRRYSRWNARAHLTPPASPSSSSTLDSTTATAVAAPAMAAKSAADSSRGPCCSCSWCCCSWCCCLWWCWSWWRCCSWCPGCHGCCQPPATVDAARAGVGISGSAFGAATGDRAIGGGGGEWPRPWWDAHRALRRNALRMLCYRVSIG